jgi:hypothetical protein
MRTRLYLLVLLCLSPALAYGQGALGSISGQIVDPTSAVIPNAAIKVTQISTNTVHNILSNEQGLFLVPSLVASQYTMTISVPGFKDKTFEKVDLNAAQTLALGKIVLELGAGPSTVVDVSAEAVTIATTNAVRDSTIQARQVDQLPLQGRNWTTLLKIIPGSTPATTQGINGREASYDGMGDFRVNGKSGATTQMNLDGGSNVDHGNDTKTTVTPALESIQEVAVISNNFQAEYGNKSGVIVNVITKSGTNKWHATLYEYLRNEALNANSSDNNFQHIDRPRYRFHYLGGNLGGPILKDRLFFFYNFENPRQDQPNVTTMSRVPTALERVGDFSQTLQANGNKPVIYMPGTQAAGAPVAILNNVIPSNLLSPIGMKLAALYPLPNFPNNLTYNYANVSPTKNQRWLNVAKVDWNIAAGTRAYGRYSYDYLTLRNATAMPWNTSGWDRPDKALTLNLSHSITSHLFTEVLYNWQKDDVKSFLFMPDPDLIDRNKVGLSDLPLVFKTTAAGNNLLPGLSGTGFYDYNFDRQPWEAIAPEWQVSNNWTWINGTHVFKGGWQIIHNAKDERNNDTTKGSFDFSVSTSSPFDTGYNQANLLTGAVSRFQQVDNESHRYSVYQDVHIFIQDTWKIKPSVTLDYGLRLYHIPSEYNTDPAKTLDAVFLPNLWDPAKAPRFYIPDPTNTKRLIDPKYPNAPLPTNQFTALLYSIVPGTGDVFNGVYAFGTPQVGNSGIPNAKFILFAPRAGIAWQFLPKTVLRLGFGWSYGRPSIGTSIGTFQNGLANSVDYRDTSMAYLTTNAVSRISPKSFGAVDPTNRSVATIYDYSISFQRELPSGLLLDLAYIGNSQQHQYMTFNLNAVLPGTTWQTQNIASQVVGNNFAGTVSASNPGALLGTRITADQMNLLRPYPGLGTLNLFAPVGNNRYNSFQASVIKRYPTKGLAFQAAYTLGRLISGVESAGLWNANWKDYVGYTANGDRLQNVNFNYTYDVPNLAKKLGWDNGVARQLFQDWSLTHMIGLLSGAASTPSFSLQYANGTQSVANLNSIFTGSPDLAPRLQVTGNPNSGPQKQTQWFDLNAYTLPGISTDATGVRNTMFAPGIFSNDITISKKFPVREQMGFELRASIFNVFNNNRHQDLNTAYVFKMATAQSTSGATIYNTPDALAGRATGTAEAIYNQYRTGVGHYNMNSVLDPRRIEIALKFKF